MNLVLDEASSCLRADHRPPENRLPFEAQSLERHLGRQAERPIQCSRHELQEAPGLLFGSFAPPALRTPLRSPYGRPCLSGLKWRFSEPTNLGAKDPSVGGTLTGHACRGAVETDRGDHSGSASVTVRSMADQAFPSRRGGTQSSPISLGRRLVDEDQSRRIEPALALVPAAAFLRDVGTVLFGRIEGIFLYVRPSFTGT